jgi:hypothetical protein
MIRNLLDSYFAEFDLILFYNFVSYLTYWN